MGGTQRTPRAGRRVLLTVLGTLAVIGCEFLLLNGVYERAQPVAEQRIVLAQLAGLLDADPTVGTAASQATSTITDLGTAGLDDDATAPLRTATSTAIEDDTLAPLRVAVDQLTTDLTDRAATLDLQEVLAYSGMLALASVGWMVWFRRLVSRHRRLQAQVTEEQARAANEGRLASLVRNSADVILVLDADATVNYSTASASRVLGVPPAELLGRDLPSLVHPEDVELITRLLGTSRDGDQAVRFRIQPPDGRLRHLEGLLTNLLDEPGVRGLVLTVRDVSARVALEGELSHQALHDPLTGLPNRRLFADRLAHALRRRGAQSRGVTLLLCDLDDFKHVNDRFGHEVGDGLLSTIAERLTALAREGDTVARLGGDEFAVLLEDATPQEARAVAARVHAELRRPALIGGHTVATTVSIGLADTPEDGITGAELLRNGDIAVYVAKEGGKDGTARYEPVLHSIAMERLELRSDLQRALDGDQLILHFQPTIDLAEPRIASFEALVRWRHPVRGLLAPADFIPLAEEHGLIVPLGTWVLQEACRAAVSLQQAGAPPLSMAVNVSVEQLTRPDFVDLVGEAVAASGLPPALLVLEITESAMLTDAAAVGPVLAALRATGIRIAIDDFGTGYSSLSYLRDLAVDVLKMDKSFVDRLAVDSQSASLAEAILAMSHSLHLYTVAEGVEDAHQAAWLTAAGCQFGQGFLWSRPVALEEARALVADHARVTDRAFPDAVRAVPAGG